MSTGSEVSGMGGQRRGQRRGSWLLSSNCFRKVASKVYHNSPGPSAQGHIHSGNGFHGTILIIIWGNAWIFNKILLFSILFCSVVVYSVHLHLKRSIDSNLLR